MTLSSFNLRLLLYCMKSSIILSMLINQYKWMDEGLLRHQYVILCANIRKWDDKRMFDYFCHKIRRTWSNHFRKLWKVNNQNYALFRLNKLGHLQWALECQSVRDWPCSYQCRWYKTRRAGSTLPDVVGAGSESDGTGWILWLSASECGSVPFRSTVAG